MREEFISLLHRAFEPEVRSGVKIYEMSSLKAKADEVLQEMDYISLKKSVREMITTSQGSMDLLEKVRVDVDFGLAEVPILYQALYELIPGPFPGGAIQLNENTLEGQVVFLEKFEGGEVQFGTLVKGVPAVVTIQTYAAGFEWTEDMIEFDRTWEITLNNRAFGRAYNKLLNHLHLSPIIGFSYTAANQTPASAVGATLTEKTLNTFRDAYVTAVQATPQRTPSVILANEANRFQIEDALLTPVRDAQGNPLPRVPVDTIIYYNGDSQSLGVKNYVYTGVTAGKAYFIMPKLKMKEFVHHDLRIDVGPPDISRLVEGQQVGRARRGLYADINDSVEEVTLP